MKPDWLEERQRRFSALLQQPMDRSRGHLDPGIGPEEDLASLQIRSDAFGSARERLGIYKQQYCFRLLSCLQGEFPLCSRLMGLWEFNGLALAFLQAHPPQHFDIARVADGFAAYMQAQEAPRSRWGQWAALQESARIDEAWRQIFFAKACLPWKPDASEAQILAQLQLRLSPAAAIVEEHWPFLELRQSLLGQGGEGPVPLPKALPQAQYWLLLRNEDGYGQKLLSPQEVRLYQLLEAHPVGQAIGAWGAEFPEAQAATVGQILAQSMRLHLWTL